MVLLIDADLVHPKSQVLVRVPVSLGMQRIADRMFQIGEFPEWEAIDNKNWRIIWLLSAI